MTFDVFNLTEHTGSEVRCSVDELLTPSVAKALRKLVLHRGVLVFKSLHLSGEQQVRLAAMLGSVRDEGEQGIYKITLDKRVNKAADYLKGSFLWHMDATHDRIPVFGSLLTSRKLSRLGGQTEFANSYAAYEALPDVTRTRIAHLKAVHSVEVSMTRAGVEASEENIRYWRTNPDRTHSLVWTHKSGRKSLVIGSHASHIDEMDKDEGQALLQELLDWTTQPRFVYRHEWSIGDLLIWDNTGVLHRAEPYPIDSGREMHRTTLLGEEPFS